jgi:hypothetical protein
MSAPPFVLDRTMTKFATMLALILGVLGCSSESPDDTDAGGASGQGGAMDVASGGKPASSAGRSGGGAAASGGHTGGAGGAGAGTGGAGGKSGAGATDGGVADAGATGSGSDGGGLVWPNEESQANSDPWLVAHHDEIAQLRPRVLVIDLESTAEQKAMALIDEHIEALEEASSFHKYEDATAQPVLSYRFVKLVKAAKSSPRIYYDDWNTQEFADASLQIKDPADPGGPNLTLCGLFEKGIINEVWCMASSDPKCGETQEAKQVYMADGTQVAGKFANVSNGDDITDLGCKVTARITDFNSGRGTGCHQHAMGHAWERYMDSNAVPQLGKQAKRFLNWDLDTRAGAPFKNFYSACNSNGTQLTDCIVWDSEIRARSGASASRSFDIEDMSGGCGNAHFYANTTGTYSYDAKTPDPEVLTSCEHYGMHDGSDGKDMTTPYTNAMTDQLYGQSRADCPADQPACDDDCGGHGTTYLYQNFPSHGTRATNDDGTPMHDWWVYLFY